MRNQVSQCRVFIGVLEHVHQGRLILMNAKGITWHTVNGKVVTSNRWQCPGCQIDCRPYRGIVTVNKPTFRLRRAGNTAPCSMQRMFVTHPGLFFIIKNVPSKHVKPCGHTHINFIHLTKGNVVAVGAQRCLL
jgi:hypothetical protein